MYMFWIVLRFYGPVNSVGHVKCGQFTSPHFFLSSKRFTSIVHILSPETDNCPSWTSGRERMTIENISWSISTKECFRPRQGSNPQPPDHQSVVQPTEPPRLGMFCIIWSNDTFYYYLSVVLYMYYKIDEHESWYSNGNNHNYCLILLYFPTAECGMQGGV